MDNVFRQEGGIFFIIESCFIVTEHFIFIFYRRFYKFFRETYLYGLFLGISTRLKGPKIIYIKYFSDLSRIFVQYYLTGIFTTLFLHKQSTVLRCV